MTIRPKLLLTLFAGCISAASLTSVAQTQDSGNATPTTSFTPAATTTVTTTGGTTNKVAKFSGASTIVNSIIFDNGTDVGIGTTSPNATLDIVGSLDVNGASTFNGSATLAAAGGASATTSHNSQLLKFLASAYNSSSGTGISPRFEWQAEPTNNNTSAPGATLNLLSSTTAAGATETGLYFNANGTIHFASGQTFSGGGPICIAVGGGVTTFVGPGVAVPAANGCTAWSGFTKTATSVIVTTSGSACLSGTGKTLTVSVSSADPDFFGVGVQASDYIQLTRAGSTGTFTAGTDQGEFGGSAVQTTCTSSLLTLPDSHD